jgi:hypothetical protein
MRTTTVWLCRAVVDFTSLAVFQAKALQNCVFNGSCSETEVSEQLYYTALPAHQGQAVVSPCPGIPFPLPQTGLFCIL